jgi:hypothetical protein
MASAFGVLKESLWSTWVDLFGVLAFDKWEFGERFRNRSIGLGVLARAASSVSACFKFCERFRNRSIGLGVWLVLPAQSPLGAVLGS